MLQVTWEEIFDKNYKKRDCNTVPGRPWPRPTISTSSMAFSYKSPSLDKKMAPPGRTGHSYIAGSKIISHFVKDGHKKLYNIINKESYPQRDFSTVLNKAGRIDKERLSDELRAKKATCPS